VLPLGNGWVVKASNEKTFTVNTVSKRQAIAMARKLDQSNHSQLVVHGKNGAVELTEDYMVA